MIALRKIITAYLKTQHDDVFYQAADTGAMYPHVVYDIPLSTNVSEFSEPFSVEIDVWDMPTDGSTLALETLIESINHGLDKQILESDAVMAVFDLEQRLSIPDDDKRIKRKRYTYTARLFEKGEI